MSDLTAIFKDADALRAYFMERGWSIYMADNGQAVIDPFAAIIEAGRAVQDDGLPSVEELAEAIMRHDADDSWPSGSLVAHDRGRCGNNRCAATILHEVRRLRAAPPLHDPTGVES